MKKNLELFIFKFHFIIFDLLFWHESYLMSDVIHFRTYWYTKLWKKPVHLKYYAFYMDYKFQIHICIHWPYIIECRLILSYHKLMCKNTFITYEDEMEKKNISVSYPFFFLDLFLFSFPFQPTLDITIRYSTTRHYHYFVFKSLSGVISQDNIKPRHNRIVRSYNHSCINF